MRRFPPERIVCLTEETVETLQFGGVVLLSGDRHVTAGYQIQGRFVEFTSSPFAADHEPPYNTAEMFMLHDERDFFRRIGCEYRDGGAQPDFEAHQVGTGIVRRRTLG